MKKLYLSAIVAIFLCGASAFCTACQSSGADIHPVAGTLDAPFPDDSAPAVVLQAMQQAQRFHTFEILSDTANSISVEAIAEADTTSTEGYGIVIHKDATSTTLPNIPNARIPQARYDSQSGDLWLTSSAMEGTGVSVKRLYQLRFLDNDSATVVRTIDPYALQQILLQRLGYRIDGEQIALYDGQRLLFTATNTVTDMGGFDDEHPIWIGEQLQYDLSGDTPLLLLTPGVKFTTGLVLLFDDMPTLTAPLTISPDGTPIIGDLTLAPAK